MHVCIDRYINHTLILWGIKLLVLQVKALAGGGEVESGKWEWLFLPLIISFNRTWLWKVTIIEDTAFLSPILHGFEWKLCIWNVTIGGTPIWTPEPLNDWSIRLANFNHYHRKMVVPLGWYPSCWTPQKKPACPLKRGHPKKRKDRLPTHRFFRWRAVKLRECTGFIFVEGNLPRQI